MKIIKPSVEFFGAVPTDYDNALKFIERAGRTCYKSEDRITENSAEKFVGKLIAAGHLAMVEHSNFVAKLKWSADAPTIPIILAMCGKYLNMHYEPTRSMVYVGGNLTAWFQRALEEGPDPMFEPFCSEYGGLFGHGLENGDTGLSEWLICPHSEIPHELHRFSAKFICDRAMSHQLVRHRPCSFAQESQRYVKYTSGEMEFIEPYWWATEQSEHLKRSFVNSCITAEMAYGDFIAYGRSPQAARMVLPNATKTEIVITADAAEWAWIKKLRNAKNADVSTREVLSLMPWNKILNPAENPIAP